MTTTHSHSCLCFLPQRQFTAKLPDHVVLDRLVRVHRRHISGPLIAYQDPSFPTRGTKAGCGASPAASSSSWWRQWAAGLRLSTLWVYPDAGVAALLAHQWSAANESAEEEPAKLSTARVWGHMPDGGSHAHPQPNQAAWGQSAHDAAAMHAYSAGV
ncbi:hypothetical protein HaLaN_03613 [Haematococcus lacustris]|uniref:Uncharacterized protein n=1 Tax=Haematococcus lacustris TaxID=44745 RepID=A0A699YNZ3_HAELA|nr:hypothetical protein HaLaN_03613 [Haematococcus lacustris]